MRTRQKSDKQIDIEMPSEKSFGIVFGIVFVLITLYPLLEGGYPLLWTVVVAFFLLLSAYCAPFLLILPNRLWFKFGIALGTVVTPVVMGLVYIFTVVPVSLVMRLVGKDLLQKKIDPSVRTYWIERKEPHISMEDQF